MMRPIEVFPGRRHQCRACKAPIVFARLARTESGKGGGAMPLDLSPNPEGNVAVRITSSRGAMVARVLAKDETHDIHSEYRGMPHFATCPERPEIKAKKFADDVEAYLQSLSKPTPEPTPTEDGAK